VRTAKAAHRIAQYILENPQRWAFDAENPDRQHPAPDPINDIIAADL
jgi:hypothetical protein